MHPGLDIVDMSIVARSTMIVPPPLSTLQHFPRGLFVHILLYLVILTGDVIGHRERPEAW